jgi:nucleotide-binding universal stress UspA family protein
MRVILAVNDPKHALQVAAGALQYGVSNKDEVAVVSVITSTGIPTWTMVPPTLMPEIDDELDMAARTAMREATLTLQTCLHSEHIHEFKLYGHLDEELKHFAQSWHADLVVIGFHDHKPGTDHMKGIIEKCPCPVLIVGGQTTPQQEKSEKRWWKEPSYII